MTKLALALAVLAMAAAFGGGCGLPRDSEPREIAADRVPFNLLAPNPATPQSTEVQGSTLTATVYFVRDERLVAVERDVPTLDYSASLAALLGGTTAEDPPDTTSSIPSGVRLLNVQPNPTDPTELIINLSPEFFAVVGQDQVREYAQLVYTATEFDVISSVRFQNNGVDVPALTDAGGIQPGAVGRRDYLSLAPLQTGTGVSTTGTTTQG